MYTCTMYMEYTTCVVFQYSVSVYYVVLLLLLSVQKSPHRHNGSTRRSSSRDYTNSSHHLSSPSHSSHTGSSTRLTRNKLRSSTSPISTHTKQQKLFTGHRNGETRQKYVSSGPDNRFISPAKRPKLFSHSGSSRPRPLPEQQRCLPYCNGQQTGVGMDVIGTAARSSDVLPSDGMSDHVRVKSEGWSPQHRVSEVPIKLEESERKVPFRVKYECSTPPRSQSLDLALKTSPISQTPSQRSSPSKSPLKRPSPVLSLKKHRRTLSSERLMYLYEPLSPSPPNGENKIVSKRGRNRSPAKEQDSTPEISPVKNPSGRWFPAGHHYQSKTPSKQTKLERFLDHNVTPPIKKDAWSPAVRDVTPGPWDISPDIRDVTPMAQDISPDIRDETLVPQDSTAICEVSQTRDVNPAIQDISPMTQDITPAICDVTLAIPNVHPPIQDMGPGVTPAVQGVPTRETFSIPCWSDSELNMMGEPCALPLIEPEVWGIQPTSRGHTSPASVCCWNCVKVYMDVGDSAKFVEALEEINIRGCYIPDTCVEAVLRCVLGITDCNLLIRVHSVLTADVSHRSNSALSANKLWELMEDCSRTLLQVCTPLPRSSSSRLHPHSAHVVMLYLTSLLTKDVTTHGDNLSAAAVQCILSPISQWRHVMVMLELLQQLLLNKPPALSLPDLLPVLAGLLCMCVSTSSECDYEDGANRLAWELSSRMSRLPSVPLKLEFLLLFPCYLLREKTISIHLKTEFVSSQTPQLPPEQVTLELISTSHFYRCPYRQAQSSPDLLFFLSLLYHLLHSHCSKLLGPSFLHPNTASWNIPPSKLAHQLESIASQIWHLPRRLSEDDAILVELTSPPCWFYLQLLEQMFNWESLLQFA